MNRTKIPEQTYIKNTDTFRVNVLQLGPTVYESICNIDYYYHGTLMTMWKTYNITFSSKDMIPSQVDKYFNTDRTQISVYDSVGIFNYRLYQKLYLVKDTETLEFANSLFNKVGTGRIHIILEQDFLRKNKHILGPLIKSYQDRTNTELTLDTCLTSFVVNGHCPYDSNNYIDISYDTTLRSCPYTKDGTVKPDNINYDNLYDLFSINLPQPKCFYKELFNERNQDPNLQDHITDNGFGSSSKRVRRLSLRR